MTPDGTCFTHDARIDGIGKKRARDYTGGLKSAASVNREFYHGRVLSLENCPTNLIATRESRYSREHSRLGYASKQEKCLLARRSFPGYFRLKFFSIESPIEVIKDGMRKTCRVLFRSNIAKCKRVIFFIWHILFLFFFFFFTS